MSGISTTAATPAGNCWRCGGQLYEYLVHSCTTSAAIPVPGRPDTTDPLDRMEHDGHRFFELEWLGENGLSAGVLYETASDLAEHVLALVAVARAAREYVQAEDADEVALANLLLADEPNDNENLRDQQKETRRQADAKYAAMTEAITEALARLDGAL